MLLFIVVIIVVVIAYKFFENNHKRNTELAILPTLKDGIIHKYHDLFEAYKQQGLTIEEINSGKVRMFFTLDVDNYCVKADIKVTYEANYRIQFLIDIWLIKPVKRYMKGTSFLYSAFLTSEQLLQKSNEDIGTFYKKTVEGEK